MSASGGRSAVRSGPTRILITERDVEVIRFVARYRFATQAQIARRFGISWRRAYRRLGMLVSAGWIERQGAFHGMPGLYLPTRKGMSVFPGELAIPRIDFRQLDHDLGLVELGIDAELAGDAVVTDREIRSITRARGPYEESAYVLDGIRPWRGMSAAMRRFDKWPTQYPDQFRITPDGRRIAIELERSEKGIDRLRAILEGYRRKDSIDLVVYYVTRPVVARRIEVLVDDLRMDSKAAVILWQDGPEYAARVAG